MHSHTHGHTHFSLIGCPALGSSSQGVARQQSTDFTSDPVHKRITGIYSSSWYMEIISYYLVEDLIIIQYNNLLMKNVAVNNNNSIIIIKCL